MEVVKAFNALNNLVRVEIKLKWIPSALSNLSAAFNRKVVATL